MSATGPMARSRARRTALQGLYQWQMTKQSPAQIVAQFKDSPGIRRADWDYFEALVLGVTNELETLDAAIVPFLDRPIEQVDGVERAVIRMAAYEFSQSADVPWRVVINEAVELCHLFGAEQSHRFVNGVVDSLARSLRPDEVSNKKKV